MKINNGQDVDSKYKIKAINNAQEKDKIIQNKQCNVYYQAIRITRGTINEANEH